MVLLGTVNTLTNTPAPAPMPHARFCAWCSTFPTQADRELAAAGAKITHGMCPKCEARVLAELEAA